MVRNAFIICVAGVLAILIIEGYTLFQQQKEIKILTQQIAVAGTGYSALITEWTPIVPQVNCDWRDTSQDDGGSGTLFKLPDGKFYILTNAHVVKDKKGRVAQSCDVVFPDAASTTYTVAHSQITIDPNGTDVALVQVPESPFLMDLVYTNKRKLCAAPPAIGDEILIFGYPVIGSSDGITVTEGIVSGEETSDFLSSAIIDNGNSGGAAIDVKSDCYFGIPSFSYTDNGASLTGILKMSSLFTDDPAKLSEARL